MISKSTELWAANTLHKANTREKRTLKRSLNQNMHQVCKIKLHNFSVNAHSLYDVKYHLNFQ